MPTKILASAIPLALSLFVSCDSSGRSRITEHQTPLPPITIFPQGAVLQTNSQYPFTTSVTSGTIVWSTASTLGAEVKDGFLSTPAEPEEFSLWASYATEAPGASVIVKVVDYWVRMLGVEVLDPISALSYSEGNILLVGKGADWVNGERITRGWVANLDEEGRTTAESMSSLSGSQINHIHGRTFVGAGGGWPMVGAINTQGTVDSAYLTVLSGAGNAVGVFVVPLATGNIVFGQVDNTRTYSQEYHSSPATEATSWVASGFRPLAACRNTNSGGGAVLFIDDARAIRIAVISPSGAVKHLSSIGLTGLTVRTCAVSERGLFLAGDLDSAMALVFVDTITPELLVYSASFDGILKSGISAHNGQHAMLAGTTQQFGSTLEGIVLSIDDDFSVSASYQTYRHDYGHVFVFSVLGADDVGRYINIEVDGYWGLARYTSDFYDKAVHSESGHVTFSSVNTLSASWVTPATTKHTVTLTPVSFEKAYGSNSLLVPSPPDEGP